MSLTIIDQDVRDEILKCEIGNILVSASAGAGKTTIMIEKIKRVLENERSHRVVGAITFTIKATNEIKDKLKQNNLLSNVWVSTNDSFVENEIIRPFINDTVFGEEIGNDFTVEYQNIISTFDEGVKVLKKEKKLVSYKNSLKKNFKFELAKKILEQSTAARQYLESKYVMIFLDEYQDSDLEMHELFMFIKNYMKIHLFIVGDEKQAIFLWRGAQKDIFERIDNNHFKKYHLTHNFRCIPEINNFANFIHNFDAFEQSSKKVSRVSLCYKTNSLEDTIEKLILDGHLNAEEEITILINVNEHAKKTSENLIKRGYYFVFIPRTPIDEGLLNSFFLRQIASLYFDDYYSVYDFCEHLNIENSSNNIRKIEKILAPILKKETLNMTKMNKIFKELRKMDFAISENEIVKLLATLKDDSYKICFLKDDFKHKIMTVFSAKGLEFDQVVALGSDYKLHEDDKLNAHYVAITRAKKNFIMIGDSKEYINDLKGEFIARKIDSPEKRKKILNIIKY